MNDTQRSAPILPTTESFGHNLRQTNRLIQRELGARVVRLGLSIGQWYALRTLWETDGVTQIELAQRSGIAGAVMVTAVRGLLAMKLVTRHRPRNDQRKYVIMLTEKGWALQNVALQPAVEANELALQGIPPEDVAICLRVMRAAHANLVAAAQEGSLSADEVDRLISVTVP